MIKLNLKSTVKEHFDRVSKIPAQVLDETTKYFVKQTPVRTGNARRRTYRTGNTITANYPYAGKLDDGYSRQAPEGMTEPSEEYFVNKMDEYIRKNKE